MAFVDNSTGGRVIKQGIMPFKITITAACDVGDLIGYDAITSALWELADADGKIPAQLVAGEKNTSSSATEITCFKMALIDFGTGSTATPGDVVYLSNTAGSYAATPGSWVHQAVGQCVSATEAFIQPDSSPLCGFSTTGTGFGSYIRAELASGKTQADQFGGLRIDCKVIDGATVSSASDIFGLWIVHQLQDTDAADYGAVLRLEDTSSASCGCQAFIAFHGGGGDSPNYTFYLHPGSPTGACWDYAGTTRTNQSAGWIKVYCGGVKYINLWD